jgi:hypothetical protein
MVLGVFVADQGSIEIAQSTMCSLLNTSTTRHLDHALAGLCDRV